MVVREIYTINIQEGMKAKKGPQIKLMALKALTAEKAINHYAQKQNNHLLQPFLFWHGRANVLKRAKPKGTILFWIDIKYHYLPKS